jgi:hypothetical protein
MIKRAIARRMNIVLNVILRGPFVLCMNNDTTVTDIYEGFLTGIDTTIKRLDMTSTFAASSTINSNKTVCAKSVSKHVV